MSEVKHTPGPWHLDPEEAECLCRIRGDEHEVIADVYALDRPDDEEQQEAHANLALLFTAPDLLSSLEDMIRMCEEHADFDNGVFAPDGTSEGEYLASKVIGKAREYVSKAKGGAA